MSAVPLDLPGSTTERARNAPRSTRGLDYYCLHFLMPLLALAILLSWLEQGAGNRLIADRLYAWEGGHWLLKHHWITSSLIHPGGKYLSLLMWVTAGIVYWRNRGNAALLRLQRPLVFLLLSTLISVTLVSLLKSMIAMDCPWDMQAYGGLHPYLGLLDARPAGLRDSGCFPAGHASSGYAWVAFYFFFAATAPRWRLHGLALGLSMGALFGVSQQLRGAHFLSHDVVALLVCWCTALALSSYMRLDHIETST